MGSYCVATWSAEPAGAFALGARTPRRVSAATPSHRGVGNTVHSTAVSCREKGKIDGQEAGGLDRSSAHDNVRVLLPTCYGAWVGRSVRRPRRGAVSTWDRCVPGVGRLLDGLSSTDQRGSSQGNRLSLPLLGPCHRLVRSLPSSRGPAAGSHCRSPTAHPACGLWRRLFPRWTPGSCFLCPEHSPPVRLRRRGAYVGRDIPSRSRALPAVQQ